jgi:hypothetical protein
MNADVLGGMFFQNVCELLWESHRILCSLWQYVYLSEAFGGDVKLVIKLAAVGPFIHCGFVSSRHSATQINKRQYTTSNL